LIENPKFMAKLKTALKGDSKDDAKAKEKEKADEAFSGEVLETFAEVKRELASEKASNAEMRNVINGLLADKVETECKAMLAPLERFAMDEAVELERLKAMTPEARKAHVSCIASYYRPKPGQGEPLHLFQGPAPDIAKGEGRPHPKAITELATKKQISFDAAEAILLGKQAA